MTNNLEHKLNPDEYRTILQGIELIDISLKDSKTFVNKDILQPNDLEINIKDQSSYEVGKDGLVIMVQQYSIDARKPTSKTRYFQATTTYLVRLKSEQPITKDFFDIYKEVSLPLNTWPFFREFIYSMTSRMNIPHVTLPLLKR